MMALCYAGDGESSTSRMTMTGYVDEARMNDDRETETRSGVAK